MIMITVVAVFIQLYGKTDNLHCTINSNDNYEVADTLGRAPRIRACALSVFISGFSCCDGDDGRELSWS